MYTHVFYIFLEAMRLEVSLEFLNNITPKKNKNYDGQQTKNYIFI